MTVAKSARELPAGRRRSIDVDGRYDQDDIGDYHRLSKIAGPARRVNGVGDIQVFGGQYAMRIWLDPLQAGNLQADRRDVRNAVAGAERPGLGRPDRRPADASRASSSTPPSPPSRGCRPPEQFRQIILRTKPDGSMVRLGDVARVEIGAENYSRHLALQRPPGHRHRDQAGARRQRADHRRGGEGQDGASCRPTFPPDIKLVFPVDTTPFVKLSIQEVVDHPDRGDRAGGRW